MAGGILWTEDEIFYLKNLYPKYDTKKIAEKLGRTETAIVHKAMNLGINKHVRPNNSKYKPWTKKELDYLRENYMTTNTVILAAEMERSMSTIWQYSTDMGLHKKKKAVSKQCKKPCKPLKPEWSKWEVNFLKETYDLMHWKQMQKNGLDRSGSAILNRLIILGLHGYHFKQSKGQSPSFYYRTKEEFKEKKEYVKFWKEVTNDAYCRNRRNGQDVPEGLKRI